jgi:tRNA modification GTPase
MNDTIAAISTANGSGAISIVRMSGADALKIAQKLTKTTFTPRVAKLAKFYNLNDELIDMPLVIYFQNPHSFTGEDIVEFQCHGGVAVSRLVLESLIEAGARLAEAGEFSKRAFINGKIDMAQAEAIAKLIESKSKESVKVLSKQLRGDLSHFVDDIRDKLLEIMAYVEVNIDYAEEDLPQDLIDQIKERLKNLSNLLEKSLIASKKREAMFNGYKVAIIGKPNVGKSSLLNNLLDYDRAIVSSVAGTTRDTIEEEITIGSHIIRIVDTAGIRDNTNDEIEKIGITKSKEAVDEADIVIAMFDNSRSFDEEDEAILDIIENTNKDVLVVLNKIDLESKFDITKLQNFEIIKTSQKDENYEIEKRLEEILDSYSATQDNVLISQRQVRAVEDAYDAINEAYELIESAELELFSYNIQEAILAISKITKPYEHDDVLEKMFSSFCVGK